MKRYWAAIAALGMFGGQLAGSSRAGAADPQEPEAEAEVKQDVLREAGPRGRMMMFNHAMPGPYWIGAMCVPADETLRAQLGLESDEGLVVAQVMPKSPADEGGLKRHDVIVKVGGDAPADVHALMKAVNDTGEKELKIEILRNGKRETITIKPQKRPEGDAPFFVQRLPEGFGGDPKQLERAREQVERAREQMQKMLEKLPPGEEGNRVREWIERGRQSAPGQPLRMHMFGPGVVMAPPDHVAIPAGVKVTIKKEADGPAEIHVERGDQKWDLKENELDKLPEDLRAPIAGMLAPNHGAFMVRTPHGAAAAGVVTGDGAGPPRVEIKIDDQPPFNVRVPEPGEHAGPKATATEVEALREQVKALEARLKALEKPAAEKSATPPKTAPKPTESKRKSKEQA
jgi:uncharacterized coiled-coil protein SlyX